MFIRNWNQKKGKKAHLVYGKHWNLRYFLSIAIWTSTAASTSAGLARFGGPACQNKQEKAG